MSIPLSSLCNHVFGGMIKPIVSIGELVISHGACTVHAMRSMGSRMTSLKQSRRIRIRIRRIPHNKIYIMYIYLIY